MRHYNPFAPALVRKDLTQGFTEENTLVVSQIVADLMGDDMGLKDLGAFAARIVNGVATDDDDARVALVCSETGMTRQAVFWMCKRIVANSAERTEGEQLKCLTMIGRYCRNSEYPHLAYYSAACLRKFPKKNGAPYANAADNILAAAIERVDGFTVTRIALQNDVGAPRRDLWILPGRFAEGTQSHPLSDSERKAVREAGEKLYHDIGDEIAQHVGSIYFDESLSLNSEDITLPPGAKPATRVIPRLACCYSIIAYPWSSAPKWLLAPNKAIN